MNDDSTDPKKRKVATKYKKSYSKMTVKEAQTRLGFNIDLLFHDAIMVKHMLEQGSSTLEGLKSDVIAKIKETVYYQLVRHVAIEGYPGGNMEYTEANVNDLVYSIISPIIYEFQQWQKEQQAGGRPIYLRREKEVIAVDGETGGKEEFIVIDLISTATEAKYVLVIEGKRSSLVEVMKQCLLAMKDMRGNNGQGMVYGFVTTGEDWRMLSYDGTNFRMTRKFNAMFDGMEEDKVRWMKDYSILIECMLFALSDGGFVKENVVVGEEKDERIGS